MKRLLLLVLMACGEAPPVVPPADQPLLPLGVGHRWTFKVTDSAGVLSVKVQTVTGTVAVDGKLAFRLSTTRAEDRGTNSVQMIDAGRLLRVSEETLEAGSVKNRSRFEPYGLRVDSTKTKAGETYRDVHMRHELDASGAIVASESNDHTYTVEAEKELVTVPAGTFECVRVRREGSDGIVKTYWYAPGLGKVKETGGQTEELSKAELAR